MPADSLPAAHGRPTGVFATPASKFRIGGRLRKAIAFLVVLALCGATGVAFAYFPEKLVLGALGALASLILVLLQPFAGLLLYAAALFLRPGELWPALSPLHLERVVGVLTIASIVLSSWLREGQVSVDWSRQTRWLGAFWIATFLSMPTSYWPTQSVDTAVELLKVISFYFMVISLVDSRRRLVLFLCVYIGIITYFALTGLRDYYGGSFKFAQGIERVVGETSSSGDPNALGATMASTIPIVLLLLIGLRGARKKVVLAAILGAFIWALALTGSRGSLLGFLGGLGYMWWGSSKRLRDGLLLCSLLVVGYLGLPQQYKERYESIGHSQLDASSEGRVNAWKAGLRMILDRPILGVGVGCFSVAHGTAYDPGDWLQPHSLYVQVPAEVGLVGTVTFFGFLFLAVRTNVKARRLVEWKGDGGIATYLLKGMGAGFVVLAICGVFGHSMLRPTWYLFAALGQVIYRIETTEPASATEGAAI